MTLYIKIEVFYSKAVSAQLGSIVVLSGLEVYIKSDGESSHVIKNSATECTRCPSILLYPNKAYTNNPISFFPMLR